MKITQRRKKCHYSVHGNKLLIRYAFGVKEEPDFYLKLAFYLWFVCKALKKVKIIITFLLIINWMHKQANARASVFGKQ